MTPTACAGELAGQAYVRNTVLGNEERESFHVVAFMFVSWIHMLVGFMIDSRKFAPSAR